MKKSTLLTLTLLASSIAFAEKEEHREHGTHEHGHAVLSVIVEKNDLLVMLETPAMNVFGFEHKPKNETQHETVDLAVKDLKNFEPLISLDENAKCSLVKTSVKQPFAMEDEHDEDHKDEHKDEHKHDDDHKDEHKDEHKHDEDHKDEHKDEHKHDEDHKDEHKDEHKHDEDHKDEHKDEHKHDEHEEDHQESTHSDVDVEISYTCKNASKLTKMDLTAFFKRFPLFEELEAQGIINGQQTAAEISKKQPVYTFKK